MSDGRKYYCFCDANCRFETMNKEQILAAIAQAAETGLVFDENAAFITKVKEGNAGGFVSFWLGTQAQYNALVARGEKDANCFYILTDCDQPAELTQKVKELRNRVDTLTAADVGAAPAGYGLGSVAGADKWNGDANALTKQGWYRLESGTTNGVGESASVRVDGYAETGLTQTAYTRTGFKRIRTCVDGVWIEWEWVNPPMVAGVEYRTTERFNGNPVYVKLVSLGAFTGTQTIPVGNGYHSVIRRSATVRFEGKSYYDELPETRVADYQPSTGVHYLQVVVGENKVSEGWLTMWYT